MSALTAILIAPAAGSNYLTRLGTTYKSDANGVIRDVPLGTEVQDLQSSGCNLVQPGRFPIFVMHEANANTTDDQPFNRSLLGAVNMYMLDKIVAINGSTGLDKAQGAIYTQPGKQGEKVADLSLSGLTGEQTDAVVVRVSGGLEDKVLNGNLYLTLDTPQGADATFNVYVYGDVISV